MQRKLSNGGNSIVEWELYDNGDTLCGEYGDFLILIKRLQDGGGWAYVVGTLSDAKLTGTVERLTDAKAKCIRYCWAVNNVTPDRHNILDHIL